MDERCSVGELGWKWARMCCRDWMAQCGVRCSLWTGTWAVSFVRNGSCVPLMFVGVGCYSGSEAHTAQLVSVDLTVIISIGCCFFFCLWLFLILIFFNLCPCLTLALSPFTKSYCVTASFLESVWLCDEHDCVSSIFEEATCRFSRDSSW